MDLWVHDLSDASTVWQAVVQQTPLRMAFLVIGNRRVRHVFGFESGWHVSRLLLGRTATVGSHVGKYVRVFAKTS